MSEANSRACASPGLDPPLGRVPRTPSLAAAHEAELHLLELRALRTLKAECTCFAYTQTAVRMPPARCPAGAPCMAHHRSTPFADEYELVLCSDLRAEALTLACWRRRMNDRLEQLLKARGATVQARTPCSFAALAP